jgi:hypothetical protein
MLDRLGPCSRGKIVPRFRRPALEVHPEVVRALDVLFILHAGHEQKCSTSVMRNIGSSFFHAEPNLDYQKLEVAH